jgi:tryptophan synthase
LLSFLNKSLTLSSSGIDTDFHSATLTKGTKGVFHGVRTYILQSKVGQILGTHSISAGLDYPGVGPEHAWLHETKRGEYVCATDEQALRGFRACTQFEGIIPALESSHAVWGTMELAKTLPKEANIVMVRLLAPPFLPFLLFSCNKGCEVFQGAPADAPLHPPQTLSGRGDKDVQEISEILPKKWADKLDWRLSSLSLSLPFLPY